MTGRLTPGWRVRATLAALILPPLLQVISLSSLTSRIARHSGARPPDPGVADADLAEWVDRVLTRLPPPWNRTCLKRAIVLFYLLRRAGRPVELRIGVQREPANRLTAHAWLVRNGELHLEEGADHIGAYHVLTEFPNPPA